MTITASAIPGQPGLFRSVRDVPRRPIAIPGYRPGPQVRRAYGATAIEGLGDADPLFAARIDTLHSEYVAFKDRVQRILARIPGALDPASWETLARRLSRVPNTPAFLVRLTADDFALVLRGATIAIDQNIGLAYAMASAPHATVAANSTKIDSLITTAKNALVAVTRLLELGEVVAATSDRASRATGLGELGFEPVELVAAGVVVLVGAALIYAVFVYVNSAIAAYNAATEACRRDAAAGHPCTGDDWTAYYNAQLQHERDNGIVPSTCDIIPCVGGTVTMALGVGLLAVLAYGAWVSWPAASATREGLTRRAQSWRDR